MHEKVVASVYELWGRPAGLSFPTDAPIRG
jgi:hypothetical protein